MVVALTGNSFVSKSGMYLNEEIYQRVSEYIKNNPQNWTDDKYYK